MDKVIFWLIYDLFNYFRLKQIYCFFFKAPRSVPNVQYSLSGSILNG